MQLILFNCVWLHTVNTYMAPVYELQFQWSTQSSIAISSVKPLTVEKEHFYLKKIIIKNNEFGVYVYGIFQHRCAGRSRFFSPFMRKKWGNFKMFCVILGDVLSLHLRTFLFQVENNENCLPIYWENLSVHALIKKDRWLRSSITTRKLLLNKGKKYE